MTDLEFRRATSEGIRRINLFQSRPFPPESTIGIDNLVVKEPVSNYEPPVKLVFITSPQTIVAGQVSDEVTIQTQDDDGNPIAVNEDTTVNLTSTSGTGIFYSDAGGMNEISSVTIPNGQSEASFYYSDTTVGNPTIYGDGGNSRRIELRFEVESRLPPTTDQTGWRYFRYIGNSRAHCQGSDMAGLNYYPYRSGARKLDHLQVSR